MAEAAIEEAGHDIDIVAMPPEHSAECGVAIEFNESIRTEIEAVLDERKIAGRIIRTPRD